VLFKQRLRNFDNASDKGSIIDTLDDFFPPSSLLEKQQKYGSSAWSHLQVHMIVKKNFTEITSIEI